MNTDETVKHDDTFFFQQWSIRCIHHTFSSRFFWGFGLAAEILGLAAGNRVEHGGSGSEEGWRAHGGVEDELTELVLWCLLMHRKFVSIMSTLKMYEHVHVAFIILHICIYIYKIIYTHGWRLRLQRALFESVAWHSIRWPYNLPSFLNGGQHPSHCLIHVDSSESTYKSSHVLVKPCQTPVFPAGEPFGIYIMHQPHLPQNIIKHHQTTVKLAIKTIKNHNHQTS